MKPSREVSVGLLQTLLARPPSLLEVVDRILRGSEVSLESVSQQYGFRAMLANLRDARSYEELDSLVYGVLKYELSEVLKFLPPEYVYFATTFLELEGLEYLCVAASSGVGRGPKYTLSPTAIVKDSEASPSASMPSGYASCVGGNLECLYLAYLDRVGRALDALDEDSTMAREAVKSLVVLHYYRYARNSELLGPGHGSFERFLELVRPAPLTEAVLRRGVGYLDRLERGGLTKYTLHEAAVAVGLARELLAHRGGLVDLLTLYLVTRYYEARVFRYAFLPKGLRRW